MFDAIIHGNREARKPAKGAIYWDAWHRLRAAGGTI